MDTTSTVIDVDSLVRSELALREADLRKDQFLATVAHELRNPLAAISNALQIWPTAECDHEQMENLRALMHRQVEEMTRLSNDLLDVARIVNGKLQLRLKPIDVKELVNGALEQVRPLIERCGQSLIVSLPTRPLLVNGDAFRLLQIFANLIHNAAKYTPLHGSIWVSAELEDGMAVLRVRDNGRGIATNMLATVFDAFTQADPSEDRDTGGIGIGLTLVKLIAEMHGGDVTAHSAGLDHGSEFKLRLPALAEPSHDDSRQLPATDQDQGVEPCAPRIVAVKDVPASKHAEFDDLVRAALKGHSEEKTKRPESDTGFNNDLDQTYEHLGTQRVSQRV